MFSNPFTCPAMGPLEQGCAELAALPQGWWEEAPSLSSQALALSNMLVLASGPARLPCCLLPRQPLQAMAAPTPAAWERSCAASLAHRDGLHWHGGGCELVWGVNARVSAGGGQAGPALSSV